jgi:hypothetical protein
MKGGDCEVRELYISHYGGPRESGAAFLTKFDKQDRMHNFLVCRNQQDVTVAK